MTATVSQRSSHWWKKPGASGPFGSSIFTRQPILYRINECSRAQIGHGPKIKWFLGLKGKQPIGSFIRFWMINKRVRISVKEYLVLKTWQLLSKIRRFFEKTPLFCVHSGYCIALTMSANCQRLCIKVVLLREIPFLDESYLFGIYPQYPEMIFIFPKDPTFLEITPGFIEKKIIFMEIISSFPKSSQVFGIMAGSIDSLNKIMNLLFSLKSWFFCKCRQVCRNLDRLL
jgi:hypothetical protein